MTLGLLVIFIIYDWNTSHKFSHIFEVFSSDNSHLDSKHAHEKWGLSKPYASLNPFRHE
jgi:hypothetical protein